MACDCISDIEDKLLERFKDQVPQATAHKIRLLGYSMVLGQTLKIKGCMEIAKTATYPLKKGGAREKTTKQNIIFTFCPFCGTNYDGDE